MTADDGPQRRVAPEILPEGLPQADVLVTGEDVSVTVAIPGADSDGILVAVDGRGVTISNLPGHAKVHYHVSLPVNVRKEAPVVIVNNGVVDFTLLRAYPRPAAKPRVV